MMIIQSSDIILCKLPNIISEIVVNSCPICQNTSFHPVKRGSTSLLFCSSCDVHFLKEQPSKQTLDAYYTSSYAMSASEVLASEHRRLFRLPEQLWLISELKNQGMKSGDSILDIGCDKGYFLDQCRRFGFSVQGVEPSQQAREYCSSIDLNIASDISAIQDHFNAITLWHVLEHFTDPRSILNKAHSLLNPSGLLLIRVPDFSSFWSRLLRQYWIWFQPQNHYVHYSPQALSKLVESQDFDIIQCISRKPNDGITHKAGIMADLALAKHFSFKQSLKKKIGRIYEHITGVEIYLIARKR